MCMLSFLIKKIKLKSNLRAWQCVIFYRTQQRPHTAHTSHVNTKVNFYRQGDNMIATLNPSPVLSESELVRTSSSCGVFMGLWLHAGQRQFSIKG